MRVDAVSENAMLLEFGDVISEALVPVIMAVQRRIEAELSDVVIDLIPSYTTMLCVYDYNKVDTQWMADALQKLTRQVNVETERRLSGSRVDIPVWYDPEVGYDLETLADAKGLSVQAIADIHCAKEYLVFTIGFNPGFAFLGKVDDAIAMPRLSSPRAAVARGSVGIADTQTAVYPMQSPGGWNIIGRSPQRMFDRSRGDRCASLLRVGDRVRFRAIDRQEFDRLGGSHE